MLWSLTVRPTMVNHEVRGTTWGWRGPIFTSLSSTYKAKSEENHKTNTIGCSPKVRGKAS